MDIREFTFCWGFSVRKKQPLGILPKDMIKTIHEFAKRKSLHQIAYNGFTPIGYTVHLTVDDICFELQIGERHVVFVCEYYNYIVITSASLPKELQKVFPQTCWNHKQIFKLVECPLLGQKEITHSCLECGNVEPVSSVDFYFT
jgi:hypothetical protein